MISRAGLASYEKNLVPLTGLERYLGNLVRGTVVSSFLGRTTDDRDRSFRWFTEFLGRYKINTLICILCGTGSVIGLAVAYGLDGPGIESRWGRDFPHLFIPALRPIQPSYPRG